MRPASLFALVVWLAACSTSGDPASVGSLPRDTRAPRLAGPYSVERIVDGDTLDVRVDGGVVRIRLIGVDTPELSGREGQECFARAATDEVRRLIGRESVLLEYDVGRFDRFRRTLAYVYRARDSLLVNLELVRRGFATTLTVPPNVARAEEFRAAQREARRSGRGLWSACV